MSAPIIDPTTGELLGKTDGDADELDTADVELIRHLARAYRDQAKGLGRDVEGLEKDIRAKNRRIKSLEEDLADQRMEAPEAVTVKTIFLGWVRATGRNPKRAKLGPAREKALLVRLREGHDAERIMRAVTIGVKAATVSDRDAERVALIRALHAAVEALPKGEADRVRALYKESLGQVTVYDDLELICRNEVNLERFAELADRIDPPQGPAQSSLGV